MSLLHPASSDNGSTNVPEVLFVGLAWYATPFMKNWVPLDLKKNLLPLITIGSRSAAETVERRELATRAAEVSDRAHIIVYLSPLNISYGYQRKFRCGLLGGLEVGRFDWDSQGLAKRSDDRAKKAGEEQALVKPPWLKNSKKDR